VSRVRRELFQPSPEGEARLLLLIHAFSANGKCLEGRTKLAKLDFFLRYPRYLKRALEIRGTSAKAIQAIRVPDDIEGGMVRYRYGPWDPAYYALIGRLLGKRLIAAVPFSGGVGYRTTELGHRVVSRLSNEPDWAPISDRAGLLKSKLDMQGTSLTRFVYEHFPEVSRAAIGDAL
jgi:hypothetical protein